VDSAEEPFQEGYCMLMNRLLLRKQYFCMEMKEGTSVEAHMKELTDRLADVNAPIAEED